jgi:MFS family permease
MYDLRASGQSSSVVYYSTSVFCSAGIASNVAASALVGAANVLGTMVASSLMDKQGRKSLLITSFSRMDVSMLLLALSFTWKVLAPYSGTIAVFGTVLYVLSFALGAGPVPALLLPVIFASRIRAKAVALSLGMHWVSNFFIGLYFLSTLTLNKLSDGINMCSVRAPGLPTNCSMKCASNNIDVTGRLCMTAMTVRLCGLFLLNACTNSSGLCFRLLTHPVVPMQMNRASHHGAKTTAELFNKMHYSIGKFEMIYLLGCKLCE